MPTVTVIQPRVADDTNRLLRVAAYCRVSSSSDDQLNSYNSQLTYYSHKFEDSDTETLIDIYADEGITGTCEKRRTEFLRLINDCRKGKIDRIYTKSISRFARNTRDCLKNIRELKSLGITVMFEKENIDTANINDELMLTIMGGLAQEESNSISQNLRWSFRRRCQKGTVKQHSAPLGYRLISGQLIIDNEKAEIVRKIFRMYLNGNGYQSIANELNQSFCKESDTSWTASYIEYILSNERYIGDSLWQKSYNTGIPFKKVRNNGEKEQYYLSCTHDSIVSREEFYTVQEMMIQRKKKLQKHGLDCFRGIIKCGLCNSTYKRVRKNNKAYWICRQHHLNTSLCGSNAIEENTIKNAFINLFNKLYYDYSQLLIPIKDSLQELETKQSMGDKNILDLRRSILKLKEQLKVVATLHTKGFLNEAKFKEQSLEINNKIDKLNKDIRLLAQSDDTKLKEIETLIDYFEKREHIMIEFEPQACEFLIDKIVVKDNILEFHIKGGLIFTEEI